jgi:hypothetical protein
MCGRPHLGTMAADGEQKLCGQCEQLAGRSDWVIGVVYVDWQVVL